ncbi:MAG: hypothetical protein NE327_19160 [Lentisphaeraceae bacterium]|nr:hypothetical protein [Lentisphaeraceae bacterium]
MYIKGQLEKLFLFPLEFGGMDNELNCIFVPLGIAAIKKNMDSNIIAGLIEEGKVSQYEAKPKYIGNSFIPSEIIIRAFNPGEFTTNISVWGEENTSNEEPAKSEVTEFCINAQDSYLLAKEENCIKQFVEIYETWNNWALQLPEEVSRETNIITEAYQKIIAAFCSLDVIPQGVSYGDDCMYTSQGLNIDSIQGEGNSRIVHTTETNQDGFESKYEFHLIKDKENWLISSIKYVCSDGSYECL